MGASSTKHKKCGQIEDAEKVLIDSSPLHCPICMLVYRKAPEVLPCGHSHCQDCLRKMENYARRGDAGGSGNYAERRPMTVECPLCRTRCLITRTKVKNFAIEAIIESLGLLNPEDEKEATNATIAAKNLAIKRLTQNVNELEKQVQSMEEQVFRARLAVFVILFLLILTLLMWRLILWQTGN